MDVEVEVKATKVIVYPDSYEVTYVVKVKGPNLDAPEEQQWRTSQDHAENQSAHFTAKLYAAIKQRVDQAEANFKGCEIDIGEGTWLNWLRDEEDC